MNFKKIINSTLYIYYFFSIFVIVTLKYDVLYLSSLIGIALIILILIYKVLINKKIYIKRQIFFKIVCYIYCIYIIIITILIDRHNLVYSINKVIPIILLTNLIDYIYLEAIDLRKIKKYVVKLFIMGIIFTICLYLINISYIQIGMYLKYVTKSEMISLYAENRLSGFLSHKSRFGIYCIIAATVLLRENTLNKYAKSIIILLIIVASFLSDSLITFVALIAIIVIYFILKNSQEILKTLRMKHVFILCIIIIFGIVVVNIFINNINELYLDRDFSSLGRRTDIWRYSVEYIRNNLYGTVRISQDLALGGYMFMNNPHNMFLNEFIESGIIGGIFYIIIIFQYMKFIKEPYIKLSFLAVIACSQFDKMIANEVTYIFFGIYALYCSKDTSENQ